MTTPPVPPEVLDNTQAIYEANERNQTKTARALGISRQTLQNRLSKIEDRRRLETEDLIFPDLPSSELPPEALLKVARTQSGESNDDDAIDAIGYIACAGEVASFRR